jgi:hypothetical protein
VEFAALRCDADSTATDKAATSRGSFIGPLQADRRRIVRVGRLLQEVKLRLTGVIRRSRKLAPSVRPGDVDFERNGDVTTVTDSLTSRPSAGRHGCRKKDARLSVGISESLLALLIISIFTHLPRSAVPSTLAFPMHGNCLAE